MVGRLILRGLLCGLVAGLLTFAFARAFGEPPVARAIAFEEEADRAKGEAPEPEMFSRAVQAGPGLLTGTVVEGAALGGLFSLAFAALHGRALRSGVREDAAVLALAAFAVLVAVPMLKYPANPPSVGDPATIGPRTALYFELIAVTLVAGGLSAALTRALAPARGTFEASLAGLALFVALSAAAMALMPAVDEVPAAFPADVLWRFRVAALGMQAVMWTAIGLGFGALARPLLEPAARAAPAGTAAAGAARARR